MKLKLQACELVKQRGVVSQSLGMALLANTPEAMCFGGVARQSIKKLSVRQNSESLCIPEREVSRGRRLPFSSYIAEKS